MRGTRDSETPRWLEVSSLVLVGLIALKTTHGLLGTFDVGLDDETVYLDGARYLGVHVLPIAESSPLYPAWYRLLSIFEPDRLQLYFTNWYLLTTALPVLLYGLARRSGAPIAAAAAVAIAWSFSGAAMTWPFVTKLTALLIGLGAFAATFARDQRMATAIGAVTLSLASYARAELTMFGMALTAFVALWGLSSFMQFLRARDTRPERWHGPITAAIVVAVALILRVRFGDTGTGNRAFFAFAQHYALNVVEDRHLPIDPWTNWHVLAREAFPKATTLSGALSENSSAFFWHVTRNLKTLPNTLAELFRRPRWVPVPIRNVITLALDAALVSGIAGFVWVRRRRLHRLRRWLPLLGLVGVSTMISSLVVYPREHYILPLCFIGSAALAAGAGKLAHRLAQISASHRAKSSLALITMLGAFLVVVPTFRPGAAPALASASVPPPGPWARQNVLTIEALRRLRLEGHLVILESDYSRGVYSDYDYVRVPQWDKDKSTPFWELVRARGINLIVLDDRLRNDTRFVDDPDFKAFIAGESVPGPGDDFVRVPIEGTSVVVMVRRSLLPR